MNKDDGWSSRPWTIGVVGHGISTVSQYRKRPDLCASVNHPACTYNPWVDRTWCLCGLVVYEGIERLVPHVACCGGPLEEDLSQSEEAA